MKHRSGWIVGIMGMVLLLSMGLALAQVHVDGHYRRDGTYVQPHYRTAPDGNPGNNWSTKGNVNPYTGERGTKEPYTSWPTYQPTPLGQPLYRR